MYNFYKLNVGGFFMVKWWMVRAGDNNELIDTYLNNGIASIGWPALGNPQRFKSKEEMIRYADEKYEERKPATRLSQMSQLWRFINEIEVGDKVLSYSKEKREYIIGTVTKTHFNDTTIGNLNYPNHISVDWQKEKVSRDQLTPSSKNTLGSTLTIFRADSVANEFTQKISGVQQNIAPITNDDSFLEEFEGKAISMISDKIDLLDPWQIQEVIGGLLQAMNYNVRVSPKGPDGGVDVLAYKDSFGFEKPIIKVQVKHRKSTAGSPEVQQLLGANPREGNSLFVSTGGFSNQALAVAKQEGVKTLDLEELVELIIQWYDKMPNETRALLPLKKIYIPE